MRRKYIMNALGLLAIGMTIGWLFNFKYEILTRVCISNYMAVECELYSSAIKISIIDASANELLWSTFKIDPVLNKPPVFSQFKYEYRAQWIGYTTSSASPAGVVSWVQLPLWIIISIIIIVMCIIYKIDHRQQNKGFSIENVTTKGHD